IGCCAVRGWASVRGKGEVQGELGRRLTDGKGATQHRRAVPQAVQPESRIVRMGVGRSLVERITDNRSDSIALDLDAYGDRLPRGVFGRVGESFLNHPGDGVERCVAEPFG